MTLFAASEHRPAGGPLNASVRAWAEVSGQREEVQSASGLLGPRSALRAPHSPQLLQPEPGPAHRARPHRLLSPGSVRPGRSWLSAPRPSPA